MATGERTKIDLALQGGGSLRECSTFDLSAVFSDTFRTLSPSSATERDAEETDRSEGKA